MVWRKKVRSVNDFVHLKPPGSTPGARKPHKLLKRIQLAQVAGITYEGGQAGRRAGGQADGRADGAYGV